MVREEELVQKAKEVREALIEMAADEVDATHIEVGQIKAKDDTRKLLTVRVGGANRYVPYQGHDTSEFTVGDYWAIIFDDYGTIRLGWWVTNNAGGGTIPHRPHDLLDGDAHPDTVAQAVTRGSLVYGNSIPAWDELVIGLAARYLRSDGTDPAYAQIPGSEVVNTPAGTIAATDVQAAINELDTEKAPTHNLLDGTWHPDTVAQGVTRGSVIVGDSTPAWNEVVIGVANRIFLSDGADAGWGQADHGAALVGLLDDDHTIYFLADCTRAFGGDPIPDGVDTRSLGSPDAEWLNLYIGTGKIYFGANQSAVLYLFAPNVLKIDQRLYIGGTDWNIRMRDDIPRIDFGDRSGAWDTNFYRSAANVLKTDDSFTVAATLTMEGYAIFTGAGGLVFGSCYGNHIGWAQANAAQNTWYNIADADIAGGQLHGVTHDGNGKLTVTEPGMYLITYSLCYEDTIANDHVEVGIEINGSGAAEGAGRTHSENKFANEEEHLSGCAVLDLADNSTIELAIRTTDAGTPNISIQGMNISVVQFGGT